MITKRAFRYELYPNGKQRTLQFKCAGVARFAYNWGLAERIRFYHEKEVNGKGLGEDVGRSMESPGRWPTSLVPRGVSMLQGSG